MPHAPSDFTAALAQLLSDRRLRQEFRQHPGPTASRLAVEEDDRQALLALDLNAVEEQAQGLLQKRFHHVRQIIPHTIERQGAAARERFFQFAQHRWPTGHRRHQLDALTFCNWLNSNQHSVCRGEWNHLRFSAGHRRLAIHFTTDLIIHNHRRAGVQVLFRRRGRVRQWCLFFPWPFVRR